MDLTFVLLIVAISIGVLVGAYASGKWAIVK